MPVTDYLDACRRKRNEAEYDRAGGISENEVVELFKFVEEFSDIVKLWLRNKQG